MTKFKIQILALLQRFFLPWTVTRILFLFVGGSIFYPAAIEKLWVGIIFGLYFIGSGLFAWGCAGGNCQTPAPKQSSNQEIEFNEIN
jgi:fucose permease